MAQNSTKDLVQIYDIKDEIVILKNGALRSVLKVSAINFELRSEDEQIAIVQNFQNFINSVDFPIQIMVRSVQLDLSDYVRSLTEATDNMSNELLKIQATEYAKFVGELAQLSNIMAKSFYVVVPFYAVEIPTSRGIFDGIKGIFGKSKPLIDRFDDTYVEKYKTQLIQRTDLVMSNLVGLGLRTELLRGSDLMNLFYVLYNPGSRASFTKEEIA